MAEGMNVIMKIKLDTSDLNILKTAVKDAVSSGLSVVKPKTESASGTKEKEEKLATTEIIRKPLEQAMLNFSKDIGNALKSMGMGTAAGGIVSALQILFGEFIDSIVTVLQNILKILILIGGAVIGMPFILAGIKIIADVMNAFWAGFRNVTKVWSTMMEILSKMVEPFANLLIPLMIPFLYLFTSIGRILNLMLMPVFTLLMKAFSGMGQDIGKAVTQIMSGDIMGGVMTMITAFANAFNSIKDQLVSQLMPLFNMLASWIRGFLTLDLSKIKQTLEDALGVQLGDVVYAFIEILYKAISAIAGFIAQLVGKETFDKMLGAGQFDKIKSMNEGFAAGVDIAKVIQDIITTFLDLVGVLQGNPPDKLWLDINTLSEDIKKAIGDILPNLPAGAVIKENFDKLIDRLKKAYVAFDNVYKVLFGDDGKSGLWGQVVVALPTLADSIVWLANALKDIPGFIKQSIMDLITPQFTKGGGTGGGGGGAGVVSDFIMRPGGGAVQFSPDDTIIGVKDTGKLAGGGGSITNIYHINANSDRQLVELIKQTFERENARTSRTGFYQKGR